MNAMTIYQYAAIVIIVSVLAYSKGFEKSVAWGEIMAISLGVCLGLLIENLIGSS
jgi:hypothetical protein